MKRRRKCYMTRAKRRFLEGTRFRAPIDAVLAGARTLEEWTLVLAEEREAETESQRLKRQARDAVRFAGDEFQLEHVN
jgi:hypothetical protein